MDLLIPECIESSSVTHLLPVHQYCVNSCACVLVRERDKKKQPILTKKMKYICLCDPIAFTLLCWFFFQHMLQKSWNNQVDFKIYERIHNSFKMLYL